MRPRRALVAVGHHGRAARRRHGVHATSRTLRRRRSQPGVAGRGAPARGTSRSRENGEGRDRPLRWHRAAGGPIYPPFAASSAASRRRRRAPLARRERRPCRRRRDHSAGGGIHPSQPPSSSPIHLRCRSSGGHVFRVAGARPTEGAGDAVLLVTVPRSIVLTRTRRR